jgi:hypothetical protein
MDERESQQYDTETVGGALLNPQTEFKRSIVWR